MEIRRHSALTAGAVLGVGMGGFLDGMLFHQILQLHNMLSAIYLPETTVAIQINMFWDGLFHGFTWLTTAAGLALLWRSTIRARVMPSTRAFVGSLLFGWGLFNLVEGIINHHILHLHHLVERQGLSPWDFAFLASGLILILLGRRLMHEREGERLIERMRPANSPI